MLANISENENAGVNIYSIKMPNRYDNPNKGITIKDTAIEDLPSTRTLRETPNYAADKGKSKISFYSSLDTGLHPVSANEIRHSTKQTTLFIEAVPYGEPVDNMDVEPTQTQKHIAQTTTSNTRQRGKFNEGCSDETCEDVLRDIFDKPSKIVFQGTFSHGFTYSGHPVSCAVALEMLKIYKSKATITKENYMHVFVGSS